VKVLLHIGAPKTGTTSIQNWAAANRAALEARGILYPVAPGERPRPKPVPNHVGLAISASLAAREAGLLDMLGLPDAAAAALFAPRMEQRLAEEIAASGCGTLLLSNEHLSGRLRQEQEISALRALIERVAGAVSAWRVVYYHRRQDQMIQSIYAMQVLHGGTAPFRLSASPQDPRFDPRAILGLYAQVFGEEAITVRVFDRRRLVAGDAVADLMSLLGVDTAEAGFSPPQRRNLSLSGPGLELLRLLNVAAPAFRAGIHNPKHVPIIAALRSLPPGPPTALAPREALDAFLAGYVEINAEIARRWLGRADGAMFDPPGEEEAAMPLAEPLTAEQAVSLLAPLLQQALAAAAARSG
jgi:hypothetical protein